MTAAASTRRLRLLAPAFVVVTLALGAGATVARVSRARGEERALRVAATRTTLAALGSYLERGLLSFDPAEGPARTLVHFYPRGGRSAELEAAAMSSVTDGWERPLRSIPLGDSRVVVYSVGPNELDERGAGDDLAIEVVLGSAVVTLPRGVVRVTGPLER